MKRLMLVLLALAMLCAGGALAQDTAAAFWTKAPLLDAPHDEANVLMTYYTGTPVDIIREAGDGYVQVNVGKPGGGLMGYVWEGFLVTGNASEREKDIAGFAAGGQLCRLYSKPDTFSEVIDDAFEIEGRRAIGCLDGEWLHMTTDDGRTGFVSLREVTITEEWHHELVVTGTAMTEGGLSVETAIEEAKARLLADRETGANLYMGMDELTAEGLDACDIELRVSERMRYPGTLAYEIDFKLPGEDAYYAWIFFVVEGERILEHNYGNG